MLGAGSMGVRHGRTRRGRRARIAAAWIGVSALLMASACGGDDAAPADDDPTQADTEAGVCETLLGADLAGGGLVDEVFEVHTAPLEERFSTQDALFTIVVEGPEDLTDPVGTLVDYLDDPAVYIEDGQPSDTVEEALQMIHTACEAEPAGSVPAWEPDLADPVTACETLLGPGFEEAGVVTVAISVRSFEPDGDPAAEALIAQVAADGPETVRDPAGRIATALVEPGAVDEDVLLSPELEAALDDLSAACAEFAP